MELWVVLSKLRLGCVGAQQGQCDKGAGKNTTHNVLPQLDTQKVPEDDVKGNNKITYEEVKKDIGFTVVTTFLEIHFLGS